MLDTPRVVRYRTGMRRPDISKIITVSEVAEILGMQRPHVHDRVISRPELKFPKPLGRIGNYQVYFRPEVEAWAKRRKAA